MNFYCTQQNVHILSTQIFLQIGKIPNNNKVTAIRKLARLKGHPVLSDLKVVYSTDSEHFKPIGILYMLVLKTVT